MASIEKSMRLRQIKVDDLAEYIQSIKADQVVPALEKEFFERDSKLRQPKTSERWITEYWSVGRDKPYPSQDSTPSMLYRRMK
jgi:hypothetical protein